MPYALARKYPNAEREWAWQRVFPQQNRWHDRESGIQVRHHLDIPELHTCWNGDRASGLSRSCWVIGT